MATKETVSFQAQADQIATWKSAAEASGVSFSDYVRRKLGGKRLPESMPPYPAGFAQELASLGNLLNQLAELNTNIKTDANTQRRIDLCLKGMADVLAALRGRL